MEKTPRDKKMKCKAKKDCDNSAKYEFHGVKTCRNCLEGHIQNHLMDDAIQSYIDENARKLTE
jgi:hypothetical protein